MYLKADYTGNCSIPPVSLIPSSNLKSWRWILPFRIQDVSDWYSYSLKYFVKNPSSIIVTRSSDSKGSSLGAGRGFKFYKEQ